MLHLVFVLKSQNCVGPERIDPAVTDVFCFVPHKIRGTAGRASLDRKLTSLRRFESSRKVRRHLASGPLESQKPHMRAAKTFCSGPERIRTPRLLSANEALYQLS